MSRKKVLTGAFLVSCFCLALSIAENTPAERPIALCGGTLVTMSGPEYKNGTLLIRNGRIAALGENIPLPEGTARVDVSGCTVVPGLIDTFTNLGTVEVPSVSQDFDEAVTPLTPQLRIIDSLNPANRFLAEARRSGVTAALCAPGDGNLLSGQSALIRLAGQTQETMIIKFPAGVHGTLGEGPKMRYGQKGVYPSTRMGEMALLRQAFLDAQQYFEGLRRQGGATGGMPPAKDFNLEALLPVLEGTVPLVLAADRMDDILSALRLADEFHLRVIINHGVETYKVADRLARLHVPVLIGPLTDVGSRLEEQGFCRENAARLSQAGVLFAFQTGSYTRSGALLAQANEAVAHGLPIGEALMGLTINAARIFGAEDRLGSLEVGKTADIAVFEGHPLERPSKVRLVLIEGKIVEDNREPGSRE